MGSMYCPAFISKRKGLFGTRCDFGHTFGLGWKFSGGNRTQSLYEFSARVDARITNSSACYRRARLRADRRPGVIGGSGQPWPIVAGSVRQHRVDRAHRAGDLMHIGPHHAHSAGHLVHLLGDTTHRAGHLLHVDVDVSDLACMFCMFPRRSGHHPVIAWMMSVIGVMRWICRSKRCPLGDQVHVTIDPRQVAIHRIHVVDDAVQVLVQHGHVIHVDTGQHDEQQRDDQNDLVGHLEMTVPLVQMQLGLPAPTGPLPERSTLTRIDGHGGPAGVAWEWEHLVQGRAGLAIRCISTLID